MTWSFQPILPAVVLALLVVAFVVDRIEVLARATSRDGTGNGFTCLTQLDFAARNLVVDCCSGTGSRDGGAWLAARVRRGRLRHRGYRREYGGLRNANRRFVRFRLAMAAATGHGSGGLGGCRFVILPIDRVLRGGFHNREKLVPSCLQACPFVLELGTKHTDPAKVFGGQIGDGGRGHRAPPRSARPDSVRTAAPVTGLETLTASPFDSDPSIAWTHRAPARFPRIAETTPRRPLSVSTRSEVPTHGGDTPMPCRRRRSRPAMSRSVTRIAHALPSVGLRPGVRSNRFGEVGVGADGDEGALVDGIDRDVGVRFLEQ